MHRYRNKPVRGILSLEIDFILDCWHWLFLTKVVTFTMSFFCWSYCITIATVKVAYNLYIAKFSKIVQFLCFCYIFLGIISLLAGFRLHTTCLFTATSMLTSKSDWSCKKKKSKEVLASDIVWHNCSYESHRLLALLIVKNANISSYTAIKQSAVCSTMQPKSKAKKSQ